MHILITGALGHIGSKLIRRLAIELVNAKLTLIDNMSTQRFCSLFDLPANTNYRLLTENIQELDYKKLAQTRIDYIIHLAAITDAASSFDKAEEVHKNNFESTKAIVDFASQHSIPIIFPSSTSVYGSQEGVVDESCTELKPQSPYAESKINEENYIIQESKTSNLQGTICRLGTIFGTSQGMRFHTAVNKFCWQASMGYPITVWETAYKQVRPYLDLDDCINAFIHIIKNELFAGDIYNIVTDNFSVQDVVEEIRKTVPSLKIELTKSQVMNQLSYHVLSDKIQNTGFIATGSLAKGIKDTLSLLGHDDRRIA